MNMKRCAVLLYLIFLYGGHVQARSAADPVRIYFRHGYSVLDLSLRDNRRTLDDLVGRLKAYASDTTRKLIVFSVEGNASPDRMNEANLRLSRRRTESVLVHIRSRVSFPDSLIVTTAEGVDWDGLAALVESDLSVPDRDEVLNILQNTPVWIYDRQGRIVDGRKKQLMELCGGKIYRLLQERFFAELRNCTIELHYTTGDAPGQQIARVHDSMPHPAASIQDRPRTDEADRTTPNEQHPKQAPGQIAEQVPGTASVSARHEPLYRLAIKTNLLYDAVGMPSLEAEYRIDDRWSVNLEGEVAWWSKKPRHRYYQIATISPEARYWFKTRQPWHGHYMGVFVGGSWYDLENGARGYKGDFWMVGLSYGYMFPLGRRLSLETGLGIGFLHTKYEEYLPIDGHYVYQQTSRTNWLGPVKLKFALVWRLWDANRKGGAR